jgi:hypothetical protein
MNRTDKIFGIAALFDTPDAIINAAEKVTAAGYKKIDVNTPYPVHGMNKAMKLKPSKLGFITLFFGLSGAAFAMLFMFWAMSLEYPMIIGGKPFFSLPAFIPITFEVTVLLATLSTVIGMLTFFFNYPNNNHPLNGTAYIKAVAVDKFGICIEASDNKFDKDVIEQLLHHLGANEIETIYYPKDEVYPIFQPKYLMFLAATAIATSLVTYFVLNKLMFMDPFNWMMVQDKLIPQEKSEVFEDGFGMRKPVEGTVARGFIPYPFMGEPTPADVLSNPFLPTRENIELGKKKYLIYCSPCHGNYAEGDSRLRGQFPNPPTLHSVRSREMSDGMLYHIITNGQNIMPSYASQVTREERWAIVNYIRVLQRAKFARESDLQEIKKESAANVE